MNPRRCCWLPAALVLIVGCNRTATKTVPAPPPNLSVVKPQRKALPKIIEQPGTVEAYESAPLHAKLAGFIKKVHVDIGDRVEGPKYDASGREVKAGTVLAELSIPELEDEARQKQALVALSVAEVEQAVKHEEVVQAGIAAAEAQVEEARAGLKRAGAAYKRWNLENTRIAKMVRDRVIEDQAGEEAQRQFEFAEASRDEAQARLTAAEKAVLKAHAERGKAQADSKAAVAKRQVAETEAARLQSLLGYRLIRAPFDGTVTRRLIDTGRFVHPAGGPKDEPLFTLLRLDQVRVNATVPEADSALVHKGTAAKIMVQALGAEFTGTVSRTSEALEAGSRTLRVEIDLTNVDDRLRPGQYAYVRLSAAMPEAWVLPASAVVKQADVTVCFLFKDGKAVRTPIETGRSDGSFTEIVKKRRPGTAVAWEAWTGEEEVLAGQTGALVDGQPVQPGGP